MCEELRNINNAMPIVLDEKKCTNLKQTILHIQMLLRKAFNIQAGGFGAALDGPSSEHKNIKNKEMSGDEIDLKVL